MGLCSVRSLQSTLLVGVLCVSCGNGNQAVGSAGNGGAVGSAGTSSTSGGTGGDSHTGGKSGTGAATGSGGASASGGSATGGSSTGGSATGGSSSGGGTATGGSGTHEVGTCDSLGKAGAWEQINPPVDFASGNGPYGTNAFVVDPNHAGTVFVGTSGLGIWKTTDCGASWVHVNTGKNSPICPAATWTGKTCAALLDTGRQWSFAMDPTDSQVLYANNGYGAGTAGMLKSTNGGVDWDQIWPPTNPAQASIAPFANQLIIDPYDHEHVLLDFHQDCGGGHAKLCFADSKDGGATWSIVDGNSSMGSAHESRMAFLENSRTWVFAAGNIWRTSDAGASFQEVYSGGGIGGFMYRAKNGTYYFSGNSGVIKSQDGISWSLIPNSGNMAKGLVGDGQKIYSSSFSPCFDWGTNLQPYASTSESDGMTWTKMQSPGLTQGGYFLGIDVDHHVLYSSNCAQGFWRVVTQ